MRHNAGQLGGCTDANRRFTQMNIRSVDGSASLEIDLVDVETPHYPALSVSIRVSTPRVSARFERIWLAADDLSTFIRALRILEAERREEAQLGAMSPGEFRLRVFPTDSVGHVALTVHIADSFFVQDKRLPCSVVESLELDPSSLNDIVRGFEELVHSTTST